MDYDLKALIEIASKKRRTTRVLKNGRIVNVFSGEIDEGDVALEGGYIVGIGQFDGLEEVDLHGRIVCPGFIDAHVHIESSMVTPPIFASIITPRGTTSVIADPHEIANVLGIKGIEYMIKAGTGLPLTIHMMVPSCVPATSFETAGAEIDAKDIEKLLNYEGVLGLGEMMNYPGILTGDPEVLAKIYAAKGRVIDGHGAGLSGDSLRAYRLAGISTDHECVSKEEALERIGLGMYVAIREGTAARNLESILPAIDDNNWWRFMFCTDDRHLEDIMTEGHIDHCIRKAIKLGLHPVTAIRLATINPACCYNLKGRGAIAPGYRGDLVIIDDFNDFKVHEVFILGQRVARRGKMLEDVLREPYAVSGTVFREDTLEDGSYSFLAPGENSINMAPIALRDLEIRDKSPRAPVIGVLPGSIETGFEYHDMDVKDGVLVPPKGSDILKIAVVERHRATGNLCTAFIRGIGLKDGAIASSVAHDSHNIIVVGDDDSLMMRSLLTLKECGGGFCVIDGRTGDVLALPLPVAGLMTDGAADEVRMQFKTLLERARDMGVHEDIDPFITLSFMALPVIPRLKITDKGLFDVKSFEFVPW